MSDADPGRVAQALSALADRLDADRPTNIGFPSTFDLDFGPVLPFFNRVLNNVGDPWIPSLFPAHSKDFECEVIDTFARLLRAEADDCWGYVTTGGSEGIEYGMLLARTIWPDAVVYSSRSAHYAVAKIAAKLRMDAVTVRSEDDGRMDLYDLRAALSHHRTRAALVVATIGTTMTEAVDDVAQVRAALLDAGFRRFYIHADAALTGLPLALVPHTEPIAFDLGDGADSISISGHKFLGCPFPTGAVVTRRTHKQHLASPSDLLGTLDTTIGGSRNGHAALLLWYALNSHGLDGLRQRVRNARQLAGYVVAQLTNIGWPAWRHPYAMTVVLDTPPDGVRKRWALPDGGQITHVVCLPGMTRAQIHEFVNDLHAAR